MKKIILVLTLLLLAITSSNAQSHKPIEIYNLEQLVFSASEHCVYIGGVFPIEMCSINYYTHQYDTSTGIHYFGWAYQIKDGCARFDQEFSLWVTESLYPYYYSYNDACEGIILYKGDSKMAENFRTENHLPNDLKEKR